MKAKPEWIETWQTAPQATVAAIVHVDGDPQLYVPQLERTGLSVTRAFRLTQTVAVNGPAQCLLDLLPLPWIVKIEPDQTITIMPQGGKTDGQK